MSSPLVTTVVYSCVYLNATVRKQRCGIVIRFKLHCVTFRNNCNMEQLQVFVEVTSIRHILRVSPQLAKRGHPPNPSREPCTNWPRERHQRHLPQFCNVGTQKHSRLESAYYHIATLHWLLVITCPPINRTHKHAQTVSWSSRLSWWALLW